MCQILNLIIYFLNAGDVSIHMCEDIIHGFLQLGDGDKTISEDISKSIELMRTAIDRL